MPPPRGAVRLVDVAKRAGVTVSTASRALARPEMVRPETRERVELAAAELGYEPNRAARSLITGRTSVIAIIVPDLANTYFAHIARAAQAFARARAYEVLIVDTGDDTQRELEIVDSAARWVDGLIICAAKQRIPPERSRVPMVFVNRRVRGSHAVVLDQPFIVETQLGHLVDLGHEHIAWVDGPKDYWASEPRRKAAQRIAAEHPVQIVKGTPPTFEGGMELVDQFGPEITAVATFNDRQAFGVIQRCLQLGIRVPEDLSVVGSDNVAGATFLIPPLTTVHAPKGTMGRAAVSLLLDHIVDKGPVIEETVTGYLVERASTAPPRPGVR
jgi:DNA-binding LacI/PurR family transcriptional regulator